MKILSVNVGLPAEITWQGRNVKTGIFKHPIVGDVAVRECHLEGDGQADLSAHGGPDKAVYAYPSEHYRFWRGEFPNVSMPWGVFGENLTTIGLTEESVGIGDRFRIGSAELIVTQPRLPCFKLGIRFRNQEIVKSFLTSRRSGWYFSVAKEGRIGAGEEMERLTRQKDGFSVREILELHQARDVDKDELQRAIRLEGLSGSWRDHFKRRLEKAGRGS